MRITDFLLEAKPYIMRWIDDAVAGTGHGFAPSPHDMTSAHHTGSISDAQGPQFLKTDGSRQLTGNMSVAAGITIDGVDISVLKSDYDTHLSADSHTQYVHISTARPWVLQSR